MIVLKLKQKLSHSITTNRGSGTLGNQAKETETAAGAKRGKTNGSRDTIAFDLSTGWLPQYVCFDWLKHVARVFWGQLESSTTIESTY